MGCKSGNGGIRGRAGRSELSSRRRAQETRRDRQAPWRTGPALLLALSVHIMVDWESCPRGDAARLRMRQVCMQLLRARLKWNACFARSLGPDSPGPRRQVHVGGCTSGTRCSCACTIKIAMLTTTKHPPRTPTVRGQTTAATPCAPGSCPLAAPESRPPYCRQHVTQFIPPPTAACADAARWCAAGCWYSALPCSTGGACVATGLCSDDARGTRRLWGAVKYLMWQGPRGQAPPPRPPSSRSKFSDAIIDLPPCTYPPTDDAMM